MAVFREKMLLRFVYSKRQGPKASVLFRRLVYDHVPR